MILFRLDGCLCENFGGFLERCCREPTIGRQGSPGYSQKNRLGDGRLSLFHLEFFYSLFDELIINLPNLTPIEDRTNLHFASSRIFDNKLTKQLIVLVVEFESVDFVSFQVPCVPRIGYFHLLHHGSHDHFDMLIVDLHALQTINFLNLIHKIRLNSIGTQNV